MAKLSFDLSALAADFAAKGGKVQTITAGQRAMTESEMWRARGYESEKMPVWAVFCQQETGVEYATENVVAKTAWEAEEVIRKRYPEWRILKVSRA
jgi:hypothetical protein